MKESIDVARVRADTPAVRDLVHFNSCGASISPTPVVDAVKAHLDLEARIGGYEAAEARADAARGVRLSVARLLGCDPDEVALVENATRGWDLAFHGLDFRPGDRILTAEAEYASNYIAFLQVARRSGAVIDVVPSDATGQLDVHALERMLDDRVKLVAVTHVPTNGGLVNPAAEIGALARSHGVTFLLDACQAVGQLPLDVDELGADIVSGTGRKYLRGPRGTGFVYVRKALLETLEPPLLDLHAARWVAADQYEMLPDARRLETWEHGWAERLGLGVAVDYALELGLDAIWDRVRLLARRFREGLADIPGVTCRDLGAVQCGIVSFSIDGHDPRDVKMRLRERRINVSTTDRESTLLDMQSRGFEYLVRAGIHYFNDEDEVDRVLAALRAL